MKAIGGLGTFGRAAILISILILFGFAAGCGDDDDNGGNSSADDDTVSDDSANDAADDSADDASDDSFDDTADDSADDTLDDTTDDTGDDTTDDYVPPTPVYGYYAESNGFDYTWVKGKMAKLADNGLALFLGMRREDIGDPNLIDALREAESLGVEVRCWGLLPYEEGYWPNERNVDSFALLANDFADWFIAEDLPVSWIVVDLEMNINLIYGIWDLFDDGDYLGAISALLANYDPNAFAEASEKYRVMVDELHAKGFRVMTVTYPPFLDDLGDGDTTIQDLLDIPVSTVPWDEVSTMVYSTSYTNSLGLAFGPDLVYEYAKATMEYYPARASIALGVAGEMPDAAYLAREIAASKAAGIERIQVYSLEGAEGMADPESFHDAFAEAPRIPTPEFLVTLMRDLLALIDSLI